MSEADAEKAYEEINRETDHPDEYIRDLVTVTLLSFQDQKKKLQKDRRIMQQGLQEVDNQIARANYHIASLKKIMIEKNWTKIQVKSKRKKEA